MDQLIDQVVQRTGISEDQARQAVETVLGFLKGRLPAPIASQLDSVVAGQGASGGGSLADQAGQALGGLGSLGGNLFGGGKPE